MPAYLRRTVDEFISEEPNAVIGILQQAYACDGFVSQYTRQTQAWDQVIPELQRVFAQLLRSRPEAKDWTILLEYPLYRLRRRIDAVVLADGLIVVVECKVGADVFTTADRRQVEEYALDLRDFHAQSHQRKIVPVLWSTDAESSVDSAWSALTPTGETVHAVVDVGGACLAPFLAALPTMEAALSGETWDRSTYRPVPNIIDAATSIFAGHDVRSIANADADNLQSAAARLVALIEQAREQQKRFLLVLTGVPGSGKTLAGLHVVHSAVATRVERYGDIVYLSGNTPLVVVLREALARDEHLRSRRVGGRRPLGVIRREVRARIQHINDFLQESLRGSPDAPPHEHVIIFDEAQRAWDEKQGIKEFNRTASEPALILELMSRHSDWCACVCLVGGGQEINSGEEGIFGWGEALRKMDPVKQAKWAVFAPPGVLEGGPSAGSLTLGDLPRNLAIHVEPELQLNVPRRSYRSPGVSRWVDCVLAGDETGARATVDELHEYPVSITRSFAKAKSWLEERGRGERRYGLVASSGARRLRADGLGVSLNASAGAEIAQWYLNPRGDIRSSYALEVAANEYTCQGLELDFACVCWGGDLLWNEVANSWTHSRLLGTSWQRVRNRSAQRFLANSYRVLLTRAREGLILWIPSGDESDPTRCPGLFDATAAILTRCGAVSIAVSSRP
ncbi:MAG TPA: DNA/RNA helicase domain-containing protein [Bryobacteraceae bacterium]|nr:DNA/RNA helicase domain-containing protein [Bryobacteraceae bacterium]